MEKPGMVHFSSLASTLIQISCMWSSRNAVIVSKNAWQGVPLYSFSFDENHPSILGGTFVLPFQFSQDTWKWSSYSCMSTLYYAVCVLDPTKKATIIIETDFTNTVWSYTSISKYSLNWRPFFLKCQKARVQFLIWAILTPSASFTVYCFATIGGNTLKFSASNQ